MDGQASALRTKQLVPLTEEVGTHESRVELRELLLREDSFLKMKLRHQRVPLKDEDEPSKNIKSALTEYKAVIQKEQMSLSSSPLKTSDLLLPTVDVSLQPEKNGPTKTKILVHKTSAKEELKRDDASFTFAERRGDSAPPQKIDVNLKVSASSGEVSCLKKPCLPNVMKRVEQTECVEDIPEQETVSSPLDQDQNGFHHHVAGLSPKQEVLTLRNLKSPIDLIIKTCEDAQKIYPGDLISLRRLPESRDPPPPVPAGIQNDGDLPAAEVNLLYISSTEDQRAQSKHPQAPPQKKPLLSEETSQMKKTAPPERKLESSEEARSSTTKTPSSGHRRRAGGTLDTKRQSLHEGIPLCLSCRGSRLLSDQPSLLTHIFSCL